MGEIVKPHERSMSRQVFQDGQLLLHFLGLPVRQPVRISEDSQHLTCIPLKDVLFLSLDTEGIVVGQTPLAEKFQIKEEIENPVIDRDVVLVVFGSKNDLWLLTELEIDLDPVGIIDPQKAACDILHLNCPIGLRDRLVELECPCNLPHIAGNDANFTIRALLMLAVQGTEGMIVSKAQGVILSTAQEIAKSTGPKRLREKLSKTLRRGEAKGGHSEREESKRLKKEIRRLKKEIKRVEEVAKVYRQHH
ncbi:hypothetical protein GLAREA_03938 [Glarea lozoyensis ATCC 20868]|uniref:Gfd2/YDR514C-like C-terminal domain-containing protein n=1 Tax=Glarea lozoyensis (strain ATCC 20868 / MF5171) TaxID=1116229 RepID=S3DG40_GLAL2|nr:uncharacterized protein GLAREA_03938 [Glarea lozoyensis ATCC 20868]EPE30971.1 hypothetical protein GLAREA_03938 [Glarea lozoyensis ATCC 20868]